MKISATRRKMLAFLGAAPAVPLAAKAALEKEVAGIAGIRFATSAGIGHPYNDGLPGNDDTMASAETFFEVFGIPEHILERMRNRANEVHAIDPDIAAKRSWSFAVKVQHQRQRNMEKMRQGMTDGIAQARREKAFKKLTGFNWPFYY